MNFNRFCHPMTVIQWYSFHKYTRTSSHFVSNVSKQINFTIVLNTVFLFYHSSSLTDFLAQPTHSGIVYGMGMAFYNKYRSNAVLQRFEWHCGRFLSLTMHFEWPFKMDCKILNVISVVTKYQFLTVFYS